MLSYAHYPTAPLLVVAALLLDHWLGEPRRWHPLVGFGRLAARLESGARRHRLVGLLAWAIAVLPPVILLAWLIGHLPTPLAWAIEALVLYFTIGARSLVQHAEAVFRPLQAGDLDAARHRVSHMVSRDTRALDETGIARATVESVLENGADAIFGAIFWFMLLGAPGALLYRLANTLDAMWGYRNERFLRFGWAAARIDDLLNLIPSRLTALSYCLCGNLRQGWQCWRAQAPTWYSPNAGPVMAAGAGALQLSLGGEASYHGNPKARPTLGMGEAPDAQAIPRACGLVQRAMLLWAAALLAGGWLYA